MPDTFITTDHPRVKERSSSSVTCYFRDGNAASAPTTIDYRIDDLTTQRAVTAWTSVTPAVSATITIKSAENAILANGNTRERRQITVSADRGTTTETRDTVEWYVENIPGYDET